MRNTFLCLMVVACLSGCGAIKSSSKDIYRAEVDYTLFGYPGASQTVNFAPDGKDISALVFVGRDGSNPVDKRSSDSFHTNLIYLNPKMYDQVRGTDLFHNIKLVVSYHLIQSGAGQHILRFWGSMDYMSSLNLRNCVDPACVGGTVAKHLDIQGNIPLTQDVHATYDLPNGLKMTVVLEPGARFQSK